jgi:hypothetical protein
VTPSPAKRRKATAAFLLPSSSAIGCGPAIAVDDDGPSDSSAAPSTTTDSPPSTTTTPSPQTTAPDPTATSGGTDGDVPVDGPCNHDEECLSDYCYVIPVLGGTCGEWVPTAFAASHEQIPGVVPPSGSTSGDEHVCPCRQSRSLAHSLHTPSSSRPPRSAGAQTPDAQAESPVVA